MNEARGVSARGGRQLIARVGDLRQQVHGFGVGGSSRRERYSTEAIAYGSHGFVVFPRLDSCFLRDMGGVSSGEDVGAGAGTGAAAGAGAGCAAGRGCAPVP